MKPVAWIRRHVDPALAALIVAVTCAAILACSTADPVGGAPGRGVYIESTWQAARAVTGHEKHVVEQRIPCVKCHTLTESAIGPVTPERCASCHAKEARLEHASKQARARFGPDTNSDCRTCHAFTLTGTDPIDVDGGLGAVPLEGGVAQVPAPTDCNRCHASQQAETPAVTVHGTSECVKCHHPHEDTRPKPGACSECHQEPSTTHAALGKTAIEVCTTCHEHQHAPASAALGTCNKCHATHEPKVPATALFAEGHTQCVGCHRPHDFERKAAVDCRSCHEDVHVLAAAKVPAHGRCTSCHAPHDVRGSAANACASCHKNLVPDHPKQGAAGTCVSCHNPHPMGGATPTSARACSACHQAAATDTDFHAGIACKQCHKPHSFLLAGSGRTVCLSCHAGEVHRVEARPGHAACQGCHGGLPHRPLQLKVGCEHCHGATALLASSNPGHQQCTGCHEPHSGSAVKECKSCHATEARTAPAGHSQCTSCHNQHSGATKQVSCTSCHAKEAQSAHGKLGQTCANCHRPHGGDGPHAPPGAAAPPKCSTCHERPKLAGLHQVNQHAECNRCHTGHGSAADPQRAACLGCHQDRSNHFSNAPNCASCHLFRPTK